MFYFLLFLMLLFRVFLQFCNSVLEQLAVGEKSEFTERTMYINLF